MRFIYAAIAGLLASSLAYAQSPSPTYAAVTVTGNVSASSLNVTGASTLSGGGTLSGTFAGPMTLTTVTPTIKSYTTAGLPVSPTAGTMAFVTDCLNGSELSGSGSGCLARANNSGTWVMEAVPPTQTLTVGGQALFLGGSTANQGNGNRIQLATSTTPGVNGQCAQFDVNLNIIPSGAGCGGGGGSGTVSAGTIQQLAYYAATGSTASGLAVVNNGVPSYSNTGVLGVSTTLPANLTIPTPTINGAVTGITTLTMTGLLNANGTPTSISTSNDISIGGGVVAGGNVTIKTPNGSNILLNPQGSGNVQVLAPLSATTLTANRSVTYSGATSYTLQSQTNVSGTPTGVAAVNSISSPTDNAAAQGATANALNLVGIFQNSGGAAMTGSRNAVSAQFTLTAKSGNTTGVGGGYSGGQFLAQSSVNDNGTALTANGVRSTLFGINNIAHLGPGATFWSGVVGQETDVYAEATSSFLDKIGLQIVQVAGDAVQGARDDVALSLNNQSGTPGWTYGLEFGRAAGIFPMAANGTLIYGQGYGGIGFTVAHGIDWSLGTFTSDSIKVPGFTVSGAGNVTSGTVTATKLLPAASTASSAGVNIGGTGTAPTTPNNGDLWGTTAGLFGRFNGATVGPYIGLAQLSGTAPISYNNGTGAISLGTTIGTAEFYADNTTTVHADTYPLPMDTWPWASGTIDSVTYYTGGTGTPSFSIALQINGVNVTGCGTLTVNTVRTTSTCTAANTITSGQFPRLVISAIAGSPSSALVQINYHHSNP